MPYVERSQVNAKIPESILVGALDDDGDGLEDSGAFDAIVDAASTEVDGFLSGLFTVPFATPPPKVKAAAFIFVCEMVYQRRRVSEEQNPFASQARWWRDHLQKVGSGELALDAATDPTSVRIGSVTENVSVDESTL